MMAISKSYLSLNLYMQKCSLHKSTAAFFHNLANYFFAIFSVKVPPPTEAGASCFNENSATDSKELRRLTLSPQA